MAVKISENENETEIDPIRFLGAVAVIVVDGPRVLALRRAATKDAGAGLWEVVSGRVQCGEDLLDAARRETREETGLEVVIDPRPIDAYSMQRGEVPMLLVIYRAHYPNGDLSRSEEHDDHAWCLPEEFRQRSSLHRLAEAVEQAVNLPLPSSDSSRHTPPC